MVQYISTPISMRSDSTKILSKFSCIKPFTTIEIHAHGLVSACCPTWLPKQVGNLLTSTAQEVIDNIDRKRIQDNMRNGIFDDCNDQCPQLNSLLSGNKTHWSIVPREELDQKLKNLEINIELCYDLSCNLQCPSCRNSLILINPDDPNDKDGQEILQIHNRVKDLIDIMLSRGHDINVIITGSGDPFASPLYWNYLLELSQQPIPKNLNIILKTNGVMMTEEKLTSIKPLWPIIKYIEISIDAATEDTYKIVRKNGNFKKLKKNLEIFDQLKFDGNFPNMNNWQTNFILQKDNYKEIKQFIEWQLSFKSKPKIWTHLIAKWHHMNDQQFDNLAIWKEDHREYKDLIQILDDPIFKNPKLILGNLSTLVNGNKNGNT